MNRDRRYGAFLILAAFFLFFSLVKDHPFSKEDRKNRILSETPAKAAGVSDFAPRPLPAKQSDEAVFPGFPIDLNTATLEELTMLPGVGEKTAMRIIEKRAELGGFRSVDQLTEVKWIGKVKLEKLRELVKVSDRFASLP